jgi:hypothetical protein
VLRYRRRSCAQRRAPSHFTTYYALGAAQLFAATRHVGNRCNAKQRASTRRHAQQAASSFPAHTLRRTYAWAQRSLRLLLQPRAPRRLILHRTGPSPGTAYPGRWRGMARLTQQCCVVRCHACCLTRPAHCAARCRSTQLPCKRRQRAPGCRPRRGSHWLHDRPLTPLSCSRSRAAVAHSAHAVQLPTPMRAPSFCIQ